MADDLFNKESLQDGLEATRAMVDSMKSLRSISEDFAGSFGQDLVRNASAVSREFEKISAQQDQFAQFEITRSEALRQQKKLQLDVNKLKDKQSEVEERVRRDLAGNYDIAKATAERAREEYESMEDSGQVHASTLRKAKARLDLAEQQSKQAQEALEAGETSLENLEASITAGEDQVKFLEKYVGEWDKANLAGGLLHRTMKGLAKVPLVGQLLNAKDATKAMNKSLLAGETSIKAFGKGVSAAFKGIEKSTIILAAVAAAFKALKFIFDLFLGAQRDTVEIARNLGTTREYSRELKKDFDNIAATSGTLRINGKDVAASAGQLAKALGASAPLSRELVLSTTDLVKLYGVANDAAALTALMFETQGTSTKKVAGNLQDISQNLAKSDGILISQKTLMEKVASAGAEFAGYMGFSAEAIANSVVSTTKMGINLQQASSIAKGLLDFESSISKELEAELLTGKQFNFELARSLALQGDFAGASAEVMKQVQGITEEQRKNPIIMQSLAAATGLTVEQLNEAYIRQTYLTGKVGEYHDQLMKAGQEEQAQLVAKMAARGADYEEMQKTITAQEAMSAAINRAKEQFSNFVNDGSLDKLVDMITRLVDSVANSSFMRKARIETAQTDNEKIQASETATLEQREKSAANAELAATERSLAQKALDYLLLAGPGTALIGMHRISKGREQDQAARDAAEMNRQTVIQLNIDGVKMGEAVNTTVGANTSALEFSN